MTDDLDPERFRFNDDHGHDDHDEWADQIGTVIGACGLSVTHWESGFSDNAVGRPTVALDVRGHVLMHGGDEVGDDERAEHVVMEVALSTDTARWLGERLMRMAANAEECMVHHRAGLS